jgi:hypothetical protein
MKQRVTFTLDADLIRKARMAVKAGLAPTLISLVERGLRTTVRRLEQQNGRRFPVRPVRLRAGRRPHTRA